MGIKCGKCGGRHGSVSEVRSCGENGRVVSVDVVDNEGLAPAWLQDPATAGAIKYATDRLRLREWAGSLDFELVEVAMDVMNGKTVGRKDCSDLIDALGRLPYKADKDKGTWTPPRDETARYSEELRSRTEHFCSCGCESLVTGPSGSRKSETPLVAIKSYAARVRELRRSVPDSRYAVNVGGKGNLRFFRVTTSKNGFTVIKEYASDTLHPRNFQEYEGILQTIAQDGPEKAQVRFGQELGQCYDCGRMLTDETSRKAGRGRVCREK